MTATVILLAEKGDAKALKNFLESRALLRIIKSFIPIGKTNEEYDDALIAAAGKGHHECVELLLSVSNPQHKDFQAIKSAIRGNHIKCFELLFAVVGDDRLKRYTHDLIKIAKGNTAAEITEKLISLAQQGDLFAAARDLTDDENPSTLQRILPHITDKRTMDELFYVALESGLLFGKFAAANILFEQLNDPATIIKSFREQLPQIVEIISVDPSTAKAKREFFHGNFARGAELFVPRMENESQREEVMKFFVNHSVIGAIEKTRKLVDVSNVLESMKTEGLNNTEGWAYLSSLHQKEKMSQKFGISSETKRPSHHGL